MTPSLTDDLVARTSRPIEDTGPAPELRCLTDDDYAAIRERLLADLPAGENVRVFAYGSLLWDPCFDAEEERAGMAYGWHRRFAFWLTRWRGTPDRPGLMLALDRGGSCRGVVYRIAHADRNSAIDNLLRREMLADPPTNVPRWVSVRSGAETVKAIAFVADRSGPAYAAPLPEDKTVAILALAAGHIGSCADYLRKAVVHLERRGIRDRNLWRLQREVAFFIARLPVGEPLPAWPAEIDHACEG